MKPKEAFRGGYGCVPRQMHTAWQRVSYLARAIGRDLIAHVDDFGSMRLQISGEWRSSLCLLLQVNGGNDRRSAKLALDQLAAAGLITVGDGFVTLHLTPEMRSACAPDVAGMSPACARDVAGMSSPCAADVFESKQAPENTQLTSDSKQAIKASKQSVERAGAREPQLQRPEDVGFRWVASLLGRSPFEVSPLGAFPRQYAWIGARPAAELAAVKLAIEADTWCTTNPHKVDAPHLERRWQHYLGGDARPVLKALVATPREQLEKARERLLDASRTLHMIEGLPWFDKERPNYPDRLTRARDAVAQARSEVAKIEHGGAQAVAS